MTRHPFQSTSDYGTPSSLAQASLRKTAFATNIEAFRRNRSHVKVGLERADHKKRDSLFNCIFKDTFQYKVPKVWLRKEIFIEELRQWGTFIAHVEITNTAKLYLPPPNQETLSINTGLNKRYVPYGSVVRHLIVQNFFLFDSRFWGSFLNMKLWPGNL